MHETILNIYGFNLAYAQKLTADIGDDQLCAQPIEGRVMNHPAFIIGHLGVVSDNGGALLGLTPALPPTWKELFIPGAKPLADRSRYPSKGELLKALEDAHGRFGGALLKASADDLAKPAPERMRQRFPTNAHMVYGMMTAHEAVHLGQLSAWRRAMGLPSAF